MKNQLNDRRRISLVAILVGASLLLSGCTPAADAKQTEQFERLAPFSAETDAQLDAALSNALTLSGASGAVAGVWAPWAGEWTSAPGTTTKGGTLPLTTDMSFRIGTNTAAMTCTVLLKLVDDHRVKLDDLVSTYLTRTPGIKDITLGQLCQQTSGLADYSPQLSSQFVNNPTRVWPPLEVVSAGMGAAAATVPGSAWAQSSTGIVLLGMALQIATNEDWASLYQQYIFGPLGLGDTSFPAPDRLGIPGSHPHGYADAVAGGAPDCTTSLDETELSNSMFGVAGGVVSTLDDVRGWAQALATGGLLSTKSAEAQWKTVPTPNGPDWVVNGLGASQYGPLRGGAGSIPGFLSATLADPASGLTVVVMLNDSTAGADFVLQLALQLASLASALPATKGATAPDLILPWTEDQAAQAMQADAVCQAPPEVPAEG